MQPEVEKPIPKQILPQIMKRMGAVCQNSRSNITHELFTIGFIFAKFRMQKFQDFESLFNILSVLPTLVQENLITEDQKLIILDRVANKGSISLPKPLELEVNTYIDQCINDKLSDTHSFEKPPAPVPVREEDESEKFIKELLEKEKSQMSEQERLNEEMARKFQLEEEQLVMQRQLSSERKTALNLNCPICLEQIELSDLGLLQCQHSFHRSCLCQTFRVGIDSRKFPLKCPAEGCSIEVIPADVVEFLPNDYVAKFEEFTFEKFVEMHHQDMSWCPSAGCKYVFHFLEGDTEFNCPLCGKVYCLNCKVQYHKGMTCKQFSINRVFDKNDEKFIQFVKGAKYKQCPKCKFWVEKNQGCDHMTCRCSFEFCYVCGGVYQKCACTGNKPIEIFVPGRARPVDLAPKRGGLNIFRRRN